MCIHISLLQHMCYQLHNYFHQNAYIVYICGAIIQHQDHRNGFALKRICVYQIKFPLTQSIKRNQPYNCIPVFSYKKSASSFHEKNTQNLISFSCLYILSVQEVVNHKRKVIVFYRDIKLHLPYIKMPQNHTCQPSRKQESLKIIFFLSHVNICTNFTS